MASLRPEGFVEPWELNASIEFLGVRDSELREILASRGVEKGQGQSPTPSLHLVPP